MKQCWWETASPVGQNRVSLISPEIGYPSQYSSKITPNKEVIVFSWASFRCTHSIKIYLYKESNSLLDKKWGFIHCNTLILTYFLFFTFQNKDLLCSSAPEFQHDQTQSVSVMLGHSTVLTCKASIGLNHTNSDCKDHLEWMKDGTPLTNLTIYPQNIKDWWVYDAIQYQTVNTCSVSVIKVPLLWYF